MWPGSGDGDDREAMASGHLRLHHRRGGHGGVPAGQPAVRRPAARVLLLEAGGKDNYHWIHIPVGYLYLMGNPRTDWCFKTATEPGLNGRSLDYPRGKVLGGCSSINGMIYMRGQARDYDTWRQMGNPGWAWDDVLPYFKKHQDQWAVSPAPSTACTRAAASGASSTRASAGRSSTRSAMRRREAGIPKVDDFNRGDNEGCGYFHVNQKTRRALEHLQGVPAPRAPPAQPGGARRMRRSSGWCSRASGVTGLAVRQHGEPRTFEATPRGDPGGRRHRQPADPAALRHRPRRGAAAARHRGAARADGVGENLQDHLQIRCAYKVAGVKTMNERFQSLVQRAGFAAPVCADAARADDHGALPARRLP